MLQTCVVIKDPNNRLFALKTFEDSVFEDMLMLEQAGDHRRIAEHLRTFKDTAGPRTTCLMFEKHLKPNLYDMSSLRKRIAKPEVKLLGMQMAEGIAHFYSKGIIHCDVKPSSALLDSKMNVQIADLGLLEIFTERDKRLCMTFGPEGGGARVKTNEGATEIISTFRSYGHTALDTARIYTDGNTEKMMGDLDLQGLTIDTKCFPLQLGGLQPAKVKHSLQESLDALKRNKVHVFYLHAPDYATPIQETLKAVDKLFREGKFEVFGLSNYPAWVVAQIYYLCKSNGYVVPTVYQGMYNAFTRHIEPELFACLEELNIKFHAYNPLCGGVLTGDYSFEGNVEQGSRFDPNAKQGARYRERYWKKEYFHAVTLLKQVAEPHGLSLIQIAFDWLQFHSKMSAARGDGIIIGASSLKHTVQNLDALKKGKPLPKDVLDAVERCWDLTRESSPSYFRTKDQMMGTR
ncbi:hypothetical protein BGZ47_006438 [Haplosporangium gracile]|nr:hypothetical protein BGZ47_006438 [Haplosporangium gracile]